MLIVDDFVKVNTYCSVVVLYRILIKVAVVQLHRDCGADPTCVLCVECFQHSIHQQHKYRVSSSRPCVYFAFRM